jgi:putative membrane protein (TIGR04086 family)
MDQKKDMKMKKSPKRTAFAAYMKGAIKGALIAMVFTVAIILLFALIIKETGMADGTVAVIDQIIKIGGIVAASYFAKRGMSEKQWLVGGMAGVLFVVLSYLVFSLVEGMFGNVALLFSDILMGLLIGLVFAIIVANFFGRKTKSRSGGKKAPRMRRMKA